MAGLRAVLPFVWRAQWRGLWGAGLWGKLDLGLVALVGGLILPGHLETCRRAARLLAERGAGAPAELLLARVAGLWLVLALGLGSGAVRTQAPLRRLPLSNHDLLLLGFARLLMHPAAWLVGAAAALALAALGAASQPVAGLLAGVLYVAACVVAARLVEIAVGLVQAHRRLRRALAGLGIGLAAGLVFLVAAGAEVRRGPSGVVLEVGQRQVVLADATGERGVLPRVRRALPAAWAVSAAQGRRSGLHVAGLVVLLVVLTAAAQRAFARSLVLPPGLERPARARRRVRLPPLAILPPPVAALLDRELHDVGRTFDVRFGFGLGLAGAALLVAFPGIPAWALLVGLPWPLLEQMALACNAFGLDAGGASRYRLWPLSGAQVLAAKNATWAAVVGLQALPVCIVSFWRFGAAVGAAAVLGVLAFAAALAAWGNFASIRAAAPRGESRLEGLEESGGLASLLVALGLWLILGAAAVALARFGAAALVLGAALFFGVALALWILVLPRAGRLFERSADSLRARLRDAS